MEQDMKLLLTGFEPFGGDTANPSWLAAGSVATSPPEGLDITALLLPVDPVRAFDTAERALLSGDFDAWVGLGLAGGRALLSVERIAINVITDEWGANERAIIPGGRDGYFTSVPPDVLMTSVRAVGVPCAVSNTAGTYICNQLTYLVCRRVVESGLDISTAFMHLPFLPSQVTMRPGVPSMASDTQISGVRAALEAVRDHRLSPPARVAGG